MPSPEPDALPTTEITSAPQFFPDLRELWRARQLGVVLMMRNIKTRTKQTVLGIAWIVLQPLLLTGMLTLVFGFLLHAPSGGQPYAIFTFTGIALWTTFNRAITDSSISLASSGALILKVYFPRLLIPLSAILTVAIDFLPILVVVLIGVFAYGLFPGWPFLFMPVFFTLTLVLATAIGVWCTMLDAVYRDVRLLIPVVMQIVFFVSPVMYSESAVPERWQWLYRLNPMVGLLKGFRWSLLAHSPPPGLFDVAWCCGITAALLVSGLAVFARLEQFAVDRI